MVILENGICYGDKLLSSQYKCRFTFAQSMLEKKDIDEGCVDYGDIQKVLELHLTRLNYRYFKEEKQQMLDVYVNIASPETKQDNWFFYEITFKNYDKLEIDNIKYLPIKSVPELALKSFKVMSIFDQ